MSKNILAMIEEMNKQVAVLKAQVVEQGTEGLAEIAKDVFNQVNGLKKFVIVGYTPSWNDGEPCEHCSLYGFGAYRWRESWPQGKRRDPLDCRRAYYLDGDEVAERESFAEFFDLEDFEFYESADNPNTPIVYANSGVSANDFDKAYKLIGAMDDVCEMLLDTNYAIYFTLNEDGSVDVQHDDYDCGY